jgi:hypothetical protein
MEVKENNEEFVEKITRILKENRDFLLGKVLFSKNRYLCVTLCTDNSV